MKGKNANVSSSGTSSLVSYNIIIKLSHFISLSSQDFPKLLPDYNIYNVLMKYDNVISNCTLKTFYFNLKIQFYKFNRYLKWESSARISRLCTIIYHIRSYQCRVTKIYE